MQLCLFFGILCGILFHPANGQQTGCSQLTTADFKVKAKNYCRGSLIDECGIENWDVSAVTDMSWAFSHCDNEELNTVDLTKWSTSSVTTMHAMFYRSAGFEGVGIQHWDTKNVEIFSSMFEAVPSLGNVDFTSWNTRSAVRMDKMFFQCHGTQSAAGLCENMAFTGIGLKTWDTSNVQFFQHMFQRSHGFVEDLSEWDMSSAENIYRMFAATPGSNPTKTKTWSLCKLTNIPDNLSTISCTKPELGEVQGSSHHCSTNLPGSPSCMIKTDAPTKVPSSSSPSSSSPSSSSPSSSSPSSSSPSSSSPSSSSPSSSSPSSSPSSSVCRRITRTPTSRESWSDYVKLYLNTSSCTSMPHSLVLSSLSVAEGKPLVLSNIVDIAGDLFSEFGSGLTGLIMPALERVSKVYIRKNSGLTSVELNALTTVGKYLMVDQNPELLSFSANALQYVDQSFTFNKNQKLTIIAVDALEKVHGYYFRVVKNDALEKLEMPSLQSAGGHMHISSNPNLRNVTMNALQSVEQSLEVEDNLELHKLTMNALQSIGRDTAIVNNPELRSVEWQHLEQFGRDVYVSGSNDLTVCVTDSLPDNQRALLDDTGTEIGCSTGTPTSD